MLDLLCRVRGRAAGCRHPGVADRAPRRGRGDAPRPLGGPRGAQVRPGGQPGEVVDPLARLRDRLRGLLLRCGARVRHRRGRDGGAEADDREDRPAVRATGGAREAVGQRGRSGGHDPRGAGRAAVQGAARRQRRDDHGRGPPGGGPLRRHGGRAGRWAARTTSTARCGTSTSTGCWSA